MIDLEAVLRNQELSAEGWTAATDRLAREEAKGPALIAAVRAVGCGAPRAVADALLAALPSLPEEQRQEKTQQASAVIHNIKRFGGSPDKVATAALAAIAEGADVTYLLRAIAQTLDQVYASKAALEIIRGVLAIAPPDRAWYEDTHALVLLSLARFDEAKAAITRLAEHDAGQAAWLRSYKTAMQQPLDHWYAEWLQNPPAEDSTPIQRPLADVQAAVRAIAARVAEIRAALVTHVGEAAWLPQLGGLEPGEIDAEFSLDDNEGSVPNLVWLLRKEWTRLMWLLVAAGQPALAVPTELAPPPEPLDFLDTILSAQFNLLVDRSDDKPFEAKDKLDEYAASATWGGEDGTEIKDLAPHLADIWLKEDSAALASIRWAMGSLDSVFEDQ